MYMRLCVVSLNGRIFEVESAGLSCAATFSFPEVHGAGAPPRPGSESRRVPIQYLVGTVHVERDMTDRY